jgi:SAM-dependent methyltransferase
VRAATLASAASPVRASDFTHEQWVGGFLDRARPALRPGAAVLDVGSGRRPTVSPEDRPGGVCYVGLDLSRAELEAAGLDAYDEIVVADVMRRVAGLEERFDLVLSWQSLEHVERLADTFENLRAYARPGGRLVALLSGRYSAFAVINRLVPRRVGVRALERLLAREREAVFPAAYDCCHYSALVELLRPWSAADVTPLFNGAGYFAFFSPLQRFYMRYERWAAHGHPNLATHYLIDAVR